MLWIFIHTITDRILHLEYLILVKSKILSKILTKIKAKYGVSAEIMVLNHHSSKIKTTKKALLGISQQYYHFHIFKNLSQNLRLFISHLHIELAKYLNKLAYYKLNSPGINIIINNIIYNLKNMVLMILEDISGLVNKHSKDFDLFSGFKFYNGL